MNCMGDREIRSVSRALLDNPGAGISAVLNQNIKN